MNNISRALAAAALVAVGAASHAAVVMTTPSLTGFVSVSGFKDGTPNTYTVAYRDLAGTVTLNNLPADNYSVSVQGSGSFCAFGDCSNPSNPGTISGSVNNPLAIFAGLLGNSGLLLPTYTFPFAPGTPGVNDTNLGAIAFATSYDGQASAGLFSAISGLFGINFTDPTGAGTLGITGTVYSDGMVLNVTETADWFFNTGFGGMLLAADTQLGGGNGIIDGTFSLRDVSVTAIPEPASLALVGTALLGLSLVRRRSRG